MLRQGDRVRFRFRSTANGYLSVIDFGTSGKPADLLGPSDSGEARRRVATGTEETIPKPPSAFRVTGPPGYDVVYWVFTESDISGSGAKPLPAPVLPDPRPEASKPATPLLPRCDSDLLRARGDCLDLGAGLRAAQPGEALPQLPGLADGLKPRDLTVSNDANRSVIAVQDGTGPIVYSFRIAHD
jgi:hypothetical protein